MLPYVVCYCGRSIGDKYLLFRELVKAEYEKYIAKNGLQMTPEQLVHSDKVHIDLSSIFDSLHLNLECCRARINTQLRFNTYY